MKKFLKQNWLWWLIILTGALFRFYKLDWGEGHFFHPDEYHIAAAVNRLSFPSQLNPKLFSYGSFTVYLIYFTKLALSRLTSHVSPVLFGRFYSAVFSTLTILVVFLISQRLFKKKLFSYLTAFLTATMPGLIQQAHFTTPESILTFWLFLTLYLWMKWLEKKKAKFLYFSAVSLGLALGTKIVALTFLPILVLLPLLPSPPSEEDDTAVFFSSTTQNPLMFPRFNPNSRISALGRATPEVWRYLQSKTPSRWSASWRILLEGGRKAIKLLILPLLITFFVFFLVFPYALLDYQSFRSTTIYETGVGRGDPPVFYTRQFISTAPILFQYQKILPYALGPLVLILGTLGFLLISTNVILNLIQNLCRSRIPSTIRYGAGKCGMTTKKEANHKLLITNYLLLITAFLLYFLPNALLFAKWTRFLAPAFPFFALFATYLLSKIKNNVLRITYCVLLISNVLWTFMFFSIYLHPDVRITATVWINQNLPLDSVIFTEQGNMVEAPLEGNLKKTSLDFYGLEENIKIQQQLPELLAEADYFIVQSRRLFLNHQRLPGQFPKTAKFYDLLFSGQMGFEEIKKFDSFPQLWKLKIADELAEETWSVFDHPVIRIYQKVKPLPRRTYEKLLGI